MANYSVLKSAIEAVIKTNGNNEITGALLQQSLISMITSLGAHYDFVDVATPSTNPGTPDQNVMYFTATAGTYTNFGGIVVNEGEFCALCWNGSWIKKTTGAASAKVLGENIFEPGSVNSTTGADAIYSTLARTAYIPCKTGDVINGYIFRVNLYDENFRFLGQDGATSYSGTTRVQHTIATQNVAFVRVVVPKANISQPLYINDISAGFILMKSAATKTELNVVAEGIYKKIGIVVKNKQFGANDIIFTSDNVAPGQRIHYDLGPVSSSSYLYFYDSNDTSLGSVGGSNANYNGDFLLPSTFAYAKVMYGGGLIINEISIWEPINVPAAKERTVQAETGIANKIISFAGALVDANNYNVSSGIQVQKGEIVCFTIRNGSGAIISFMDGTDYVPVLCDTGHEFVTTGVSYFYRVPNDMTIYICFYGDSAPLVKIYSSFSDDTISWLMDGGNNSVKPATSVPIEVIKLIQNQHLENGNKIVLQIAKDKNITTNRGFRYGGVYNEVRKNLLRQYFISDKYGSLTTSINTSDEPEFIIEKIKSKFVQAAQSEAQTQIQALENFGDPGFTVPQITNYDTIVVANQTAMDGLNAAISQKVNNDISVLVIFRNGIYRFNDTNKIVLNNINAPNVHVSFVCENASIIADGSIYAAGEEIGDDGIHRIFTENASFDYQNTITDGRGNYYYPDINGGRGVLRAAGQISKVSDLVYSMPIKSSYGIDSGAIGKNIFVTADWTQYVGTITNVASNTITFTVPSVVENCGPNADYEKRGMYAYFKIVNYKNGGNPAEYFLGGGKIHVPKADNIYRCEYGTFAQITDCTFGSVNFAKMDFIGTAYNKGALLELGGTGNVSITACSFACIGNVVNSLRTTVGTWGANILVQKNKFVNCGIGLNMSGDSLSIRDNQFNKMGYYWFSSRPINVFAGVDWYVAGNKIVDFNYSAIFIQNYPSVYYTESQSRGVIEKNIVTMDEWAERFFEHHLCDSGAIQLSMTYQQIICRYNIIYNYRTREAGRGIMMGGNCSKIKIYGNVISKCPSSYAIDFYGTTYESELNTQYPSGVENLCAYNIVDTSIEMLSNSNFASFPEYTKTDDDCVFGHNIIGGKNFRAGMFSYTNAANLSILEAQYLDDELTVGQNGEIYTSVDVSNWGLDDFVLSKIIRNV